MRTQQNMQYKAARSTRLLNNHVKDLFGQQKAVVLYGFKVLPGSSQNRIKITGGAVFTHYGQKIAAYDETVIDMEVPIQAATEDYQMYAVVMRHNYVADTSVNEPVFEIIHMKDWLPKDLSPVKDIREVNPITGAITTNSPTLEHSEYNINEGLNKDAFDSMVYGQDDDILGYDQIVLAKIIVKSGTNVVEDVSGEFKFRATVYQYVNPFEQLIDYLGINIFEPAASDYDITTGEFTSLKTKERWTDGLISGDEQTPFIGGMSVSGSTVTASHDFLKPGAYVGTYENRTPVNSPLYGFFSSSDPTLQKAQYKYASFLDDGHSVKWNLQRLSEILRSLESIVGGHPETALTRLMENKSPADIAASISSNSIPNSYSASEDFVVKSGKVGWAKPPIGDNSAYAATHDWDSVGTVTLGDNHHTAIALIDKAISYLWHNRLGLNGVSYGAGISRNDLYSFSIGASSLSFDREQWDTTDITGDVGEHDTYHGAIQNIIDNKMHRHDGIGHGWMHFGVNTISQQSASAYFKNFETINGFPAWFDYSQSLNAYNADCPIHIGAKGIIVNAVTGQLGVNIIQDFGLSIGTSASLSKYTIGYPATITGTYDTGLAASNVTFSCAQYSRSTIVGNEFINVSTRKTNDAKLLLTASASSSAVLGSIFTITWASDWATYNSIEGFPGTISGTVSRKTSLGNTIALAVQFSGFLPTVKLEDFFPFDTDFYTKELSNGRIVSGVKGKLNSVSDKYMTPWTAIDAYRVDHGSSDFLGQDVGLATITFSNGNSYSLYRYHWEFEPDNYIYSGKVNFLDRLSRGPTLEVTTAKGSKKPYHISSEPFHFPGFVVLGSEPPEQVLDGISEDFPGIYGGGYTIQGENIQLKASVLEFTGTMIFKAGSTIQFENGAKLIAENQDYLVIRNNVAFNQDAKYTSKWWVSNTLDIARFNRIIVNPAMQTLANADLFTGSSDFSNPTSWVKMVGTMEDARWTYQEWDDTPVPPEPSYG